MCWRRIFVLFWFLFCTLCAFAVSILRCALVKRRDGAPAKIKSWKVKVELWKGCKMLKGSRGTRARCWARRRAGGTTRFLAWHLRYQRHLELVRCLSLCLSLPLALVLYICMCILFLMFCFLTLAVICSACVYECCVRACASSSLSAVPGIVYNTTQRRVYIFVFCVFFTCSSRSTCYPVCLSQNVLFCLAASTSTSASACLGLLVVITRVICVFFPLLAGQQKSKMMCYGVTWHVSYMLLLRRVVGLGGFWFFTCNVLQAKKKWVLAAVQNCHIKRVRSTSQILHIVYFCIVRQLTLLLYLLIDVPLLIIT